jgi:hypothetical protein
MKMDIGWRPIIQTKTLLSPGLWILSASRITSLPIPMYSNLISNFTQNFPDGKLSPNCKHVTRIIYGVQLSNITNESVQLSVSRRLISTSLRMLRLSFSKVPAFQLNNFQVETQYNFKSTRFFSLDLSIVSYTQSPVFKDNVGVIPLITFNLANSWRFFYKKTWNILPWHVGSHGSW